MTSDYPFSGREALQNSNYINPHTKPNIKKSSFGLVSPAQSEEIHEEIQRFISAPDFPCLAAKASLNTNSYRVGIYSQLAHSAPTKGLAHDLLQFIEERETIGTNYTSFLAAFTSPALETEEDFEHLLWEQLKMLHQQSSRHFLWDRTVSSNPEDPEFSFSFGGKAFYVVGMHPAASRKARKFPYPLLVFNQHEQFEALKQKGTYSTMKKKIRQRDRQLQGSMNPMLKDFGEASEARQYSGREVSENWKCPFHS